MTTIEADPQLLKRALDNLLRNAMRYAQNQIVLEIVETPDKSCIHIHDDGCGVEEKIGPIYLMRFIVPTNRVTRAPVVLA